MRLSLAALAILSALPLTALCAKKRATPETFQLYGYNRGFGGRTLFYADGFAYIGDGRGLNTTDIAHVQFFSSSNGVWTAELLPTNSTSTSSNVTFMVPNIGNTDRRVGFVNSDATPTDVVTSGFRFYGSLAALLGSDGQLETLFTGLNVTRGVQALYWNDTSLGQTPVVLRNEAPSNPGN